MSFFVLADACFKGALNSILEVDTERSQISEAELVPQIKKILSTFLVVPDNPDCSILNLTRILLNTLQTYPWQNYQFFVSIYLSALDMVSVMAQDLYPYHIDKGNVFF